MPPPPSPSRGLKSPQRTPRKAGRPAASVTTGISRASIIEVALEMSKTVPLQDLSIVMVAKTMEVTPALLHYYLGGRDSLTSGVMNAFYRKVIEAWPVSLGTADGDITAAVRTVYNMFIIYAGIASYTLLNNKFRIFQLVDDGERDYGVEMLEKFTAEVMKAGCSTERTGIYAHMMLDFAISSAHHKVAHRYPGEHRRFLRGRTDALDLRQFPAIAFTKDALINLDAQAAFDEGCRLFLTGLRSEPGRQPSSSPQGVGGTKRASAKTTERKVGTRAKPAVAKAPARS